MNSLDSLDSSLPTNVTSRFISVNDLNVFILEALPTSFHQPSPLLILLHGFPELAYSWRKVMVPLATSGFVVVAPDQRGFGQTRQSANSSEKKVTFEDDLSPYRILNMVNDIVALVYTLGYTSVAGIVGHDFGARIAAHCALVRPDLFKSVVLMSSPFRGPPSLDSAQVHSPQTPFELLDGQLATLYPPRKHYMMYYSTTHAADDMLNPPCGLHNFLRTYYHVKSADWEGNHVQPLEGSPPSVFSTLPNYYIMPLSETMPGCLLAYAPSTDKIISNMWLPDSELAVYVAQYTKTGFQGALNTYRCLTDPRWLEDLRVLTGKQVEVPAMFIAGTHDWGTYQMPGAAEQMKSKACLNMRNEDFVLIEGAGHWVQQEQPKAVVDNILRFLTRSP